ncbi:MAG TPA: hypothetical protein VFW47_13070, partial [Phenylobacterium sp.]|nr:hypothetical protein [Phenylobacterium sp.]
VLGAAGGAAIGKNSAACSPGQQRQGYYSRGQRYYGSNYDNRAYGSDRGYDYDRSRYDDDRASAYDRYGNSYPVSDRSADANGCALAESPIYLPDGRVQKRFVRVCQDSSGRYQVVD